MESRDPPCKLSKLKRSLWLNWQCDLVAFELDELAGHMDSQETTKALCVLERACFGFIVMDSLLELDEGDKSEDIETVRRLRELLFSEVLPALSAARRNLPTIARVLRARLEPELHSQPEIAEALARVDHLVSCTQSSPPYRGPVEVNQQPSRP